MQKEKEDSLPLMFTEVPLKDKVVLLLNGTNRGGRSLALSLAKNGADIALVYRRAHAGLAREMMSAVKAEGRRCLVIRAEHDGPAFSQKVIRQTIEGLGKLDVFIDYSSLPPDTLALNSSDDIDREHRDQKKHGPFNNVEMFSAVLDQLATNNVEQPQND